MQKPVIQNNLVELLADHTPPCLSLYQPTHRNHPEKMQDAIRYKNLVKTLEESLLRQYSKRQVAPLIEPFQELAGKGEFWNHVWHGLAVFGGPDFFRIVKLHRPVPELAVAAANYHVKPLLRIQQSAGRFQILSLNRREIMLFEGNRDVLDPVDLAPKVPRTIFDALGEEITKPHLTVSSHAGVGGATHHGHGSRKEDQEIDDERFFRAIDRAILACHSRPSGLPLLLAAPAEFHTPFRVVSENPFLLDVALDADARHLTPEELLEKAWKLLEPKFRTRLNMLVEEIEQAAGKGIGSKDLEQVARAAAEGRIRYLLVEAERRIPGRLDTATGSIIPNTLDNPQVDDLLDEVAELALRNGGEVIIVPAADMPVDTGVAASFRF